MNEITELYKQRVHEITERLIKLQSDTTLASFYANESLYNAIESMTELCQFIYDHPTAKETIHRMASKRLCLWKPILKEVYAKSEEFKQRIARLGLPVDVDKVDTSH